MTRTLLVLLFLTGTANALEVSKNELHQLTFNPNYIKANGQLTKSKNIIQMFGKPHKVKVDVYYTPEWLD